jgi:asparagine synthase (glutamine-hydrolysing)
MFAFALWDAVRQTLFCARDRLGKKPLYYFWDGKLFAFASEIKALLTHPSISTVFDESVLSEYLAFGFISDERTFFKGIKKLMPGHHLTLDLRAAAPPRIEKYWDVPRFGEFRQDYGCRSDQDWIRETGRRLEETVRMRLMADVPLGVFLSGGVDSGAIAALVSRMADGPVKTFSVGYREQQYSELSLAAETARIIEYDRAWAANRTQFPPLVMRRA